MPRCTVPHRLLQKMPREDQIAPHALLSIRFVSAAETKLPSLEDFC